MRYPLLAVLLLSGVLSGCGASTPSFTNSQELAALQSGTWSGENTTFTVSSADGTLSIASATCPVTFNVGLALQPGKSLVGSAFTASGPDSIGYELNSLQGTFVSANQISLALTVSTPCQSQAAEQFTLTEN